MDILLLGHDKKKVKDMDGIQQTSPWACAQVNTVSTFTEYQRYLLARAPGFPKLHCGRVAAAVQK